MVTVNKATRLFNKFRALRGGKRYIMKTVKMTLKIEGRGDVVVNILENAVDELLERVEELNELADFWGEKPERPKAEGDDEVFQLLTDLMNDDELDF